jgi:hypothetical protein
VKNADATPATTAFVRGNQAFAAGDEAAAEKEWRAALSAAGKDHPQRARIAEALIGVLSGRDAHRECADLARDVGAELPAGTSKATVLASGLACARDGKISDAKVVLADAVLRALEDPDPRMLADDRSALFEELTATRKADGDEAGALATAKQWVAFLDDAAAKAPSKEARTALDPDRLSADLALGDPARAIPMLIQSERDFPSDYNPPARLALVYLKTKQLGEAKAAIDRAAARVYGPRAMRVFSLAADIAKERNDAAGERAALEQALTRTEHAVLNRSQKKLRERLSDRLLHLK